ncbi:MAG: SpoIIE family protein phosphatase [Spirochaetales bacterium]|nr:SpoIIE family protein phosphatase [Spirochaetales bacterium]
MNNIPFDQERHIEDLRNILDLTRLLASDLSLDEILNIVLEASTRIIRADRSSLFLLDEENSELYSRIAQGSEISEIRFPANKGIAGASVSTGKIINIPDCSNDRRFNADIDSRTGYKTRTLLCAPIRSFEGRIIGVVEVLNKHEGVFTDYDEYLLELFAAHAGVSIERAILINHYMEKMTLESEINIAHEIQESLTPQLAPSIPGYDISCLSRQCEKTGGDYIDFVELENSKLAIAIGDATGHGLGAALLMLVARSTFRTLLLSYESMPELIKIMNERLEGDVEDTHNLTFFYSVLDFKNHELKFVNCGQDTPLLYRAARETTRELGVSSLPLGITLNARFEEGKPLSLERGDILLLYTDGVTETMNVKDEEYGIGRLKDVVKRHSNKDAVSIRDAILWSVSDFAGECRQQDDLSLIVIKRNS